MPTLSTELRGALEAAIGREKGTGGARAIAEAAAESALSRLDVDRPEPRGHLSEAERQLRVKLRARARQLGDRLRDGRQGTDRLVEACAYEHWHRMLFARFLAENRLLMHPDGYDVSIEDCAEFAAEEGIDAWEFAGRCASRALPQIFRPDDPLLAVSLAAEHRRALEGVLAGLPPEVFTASDSLGWVYQFWQAQRKKQVNDSEVKIGADELPAVTQLFTEPYMVAFLLQNTLGAWWVGAGRALPFPMPYLRMLDDGSPAAGCYEGWPKTARDLKVLDPCCGSGHFLVAAFEILVAFRTAEGLSRREACDAVLRENLHGLEIDNRCVQIAAFALALAAWTYPGARGYRPLPPMNVACSGLSVAPMPLPDETAAEAAKRQEDTKRIRDRWMRAGRDSRQQRGMGRLFDLFVDAPVLGSLIDPTRESPEPLLCAPAAELLPLLERVLNEELVGVDPEEHENHVAARGTAEAARVLSGRFHLLATNVPYLASGRQSAVLRRHVETFHAQAKTDLSTVMLDRIWGTCSVGGAVAAVTPLNWLLLPAYAPLRDSWLQKHSICVVARLGPRAFRAISGEVVNVVLVTASPGAPASGHRIIGFDCTAGVDADQKAAQLREAEAVAVTQVAQRANPNSVISMQTTLREATVGGVAEGWQGIVTGDDNKFVIRFWELAEQRTRWARLQLPPQRTREYEGRSGLVRWDGGSGDLHRRSSAHNFPTPRMLGRKGIAVQRMAEMSATLFDGDVFGDHVAPIIPTAAEHRTALWCFASSPEFAAAIRAIDNGLKAAVGSVLRVPFDLAHWQKVAAEKYPNGLPEPYSEDPTQWLFKGTVTPSDAPLQVAVARLLGYRWPDQPQDPLDALADPDGIVCIPPVGGEVAAAERLRDLLRLAYGAAWSTGREQTLLGGVGYANRSLEDWLRMGFFEQHCKLFHQRPFIWQVWDGHKEGFSALVNYHRLDKKLLESLTFRYLGDWIARQRDAEREGAAGAAERLRRAEDLQRRLKLILQGEAPYDIFVRWKPLATQPTGWQPDLNDGVRLNIRPFVEAGVLRWTPGIKWGKDRGKNPPGSPWGEDRDNDKHLTLAEKAAARDE